MTRSLKWLTHADLAIKKRCTVDREEYLDHMTFRRNQRPLFTEIFGPLVGLKEEWEEQGASAQELDFSAFPYRCERRGQIPVRTGCMSGITPQLIEETDHHILTRDEMGRTMRMMKGVATLPLPMDYPMHNMDDWRQIKHWYQFSEARLGLDWERVAQEHRTAGRVVTVSIPGGFDEPRQLLG